MKVDLEECLQLMRDVLQLDEDFGQGCDSPESLCRLLSDGEQLCCILCVLSGGSVSPDCDGTVSFYSENSRILAKRNVRFFLAKCVEHFSIRREDLFEPDDLLELRRPERVLAGLWALLKKSYEQLAIRRRSEMVYATVTEDDAGAGGQLAQNIVKEICQLERQLVAKLESMLRFRHELRGLLSLWSDELIESTFRHVEDLLRVHENFHGKMSYLADRGTAEFCSGLADLFRAVKPQLEVYAKYYSHYPLAKAKLEEELAAKPSLREQLSQLERYFQVDSFNLLFDAPLRQVFNYSMLFDRLLVTASRELPETAASVEAALSDCKRLLNHFNECKRSSEKAAATRQLLQQVVGLPSELCRLEEIGLHRADGKLKVRLNQQTEQYCYCLLTDRMVIVAKPKAKKKSEYLFSVQITDGLQLDFFVRQDNAGGTGTLGRPRNLSFGMNGQSREFTMRHPSKGTVTFRTLAGAKRSMDVCKWGRLVTLAKAFNFPSGWDQNGHRFQLRTFPSGSECSRCKETLVGSALQGYYCEHCRMQLDMHCLQTLVSQPQPQPRPEPPRPKSFPPGQGRGQDRPPEETDFFHRDLPDRGSAERFLARSSAGPGAFLFRRSAQLVLSIKWDQDRVFHLLVHEDNQEDSLGGAKYSVDKKDSGKDNMCWHASLDRLVEHYRTNQLRIGGALVSLTVGIQARATTVVYMNG